jgi:hypothetical protein
MECASCKFDMITDMCHTADMTHCVCCNDIIQSQFEICHQCSKNHGKCVYCNNIINGETAENLVMKLDIIKDNHVDEVKQMVYLFEQMGKHSSEENFPQCEYDRINLHYTNIKNLILSNQRDFSKYILD